MPDTFYQKFRLPINEIKAPEIKDTRDQYRKASGERELVLSKSFRDIILTLEMYWANKEDFIALSAMLEHSDVRFNGLQAILLDQVKVELPSDFSEQYKGTFTCILKDETPANYLPMGMLSGGTNNYFYNNFYYGS